MINKIDCKLIDRIDYILHVADIHIRNWKRHKEYKEVFTNLYAAVEKLPANSIVTIGGDIAHAKTDMSPELVHMIADFFTQLGNRVPTIVIAGNHDTNLNNNQRLDVLTPIVETLDHPNVFYLRDSGVYQIGDATISVMSLLNPKDSYPVLSSANLEPNSKRIAMYHGTIANSKVDSGFGIVHGLDWDLFAGYDVVLLGDIHKRQILSESQPLMFYPGSLIQQNFGESYDGHGYALVDLTQASPLVSMVDIANQYGFYTIEISNNQLPTQLPITNKTNVRLVVSGTSAAEIKDIVTQLHRQYGVSDVGINNLDQLSKSVDNVNWDPDVYQGDIRNSQVQRQLLSAFFNNQPIDAAVLDQIYKLSDQYNFQLTHSEVARGVIWKPKRFEFSNMFSYGENNIIDFDSLQGTCGLFAPNHSGKSAILDALCFCLFDYTSRASKADQVLNNKKDWFSCKLVFEMNGLQYTIVKKATRYTKGPLAGRLRVDIDFSYINSEGEVVSLNGEQRRDTDRIIQSYIGTFSDFVLTALSMQGSASNFVEKTQGERKELLANFLDLTVFDSLYELANKEAKAITILLENYQKQDYDSQIVEQELLLTKLTDKKTVIDNLVLKLEDQHTKLNQELNQLNKQLLPVDYHGLSIDELTLQKSQVDSRLAEVSDQVVKQTAICSELQTRHTQIETELSQQKAQFDQQAYQQLVAKRAEVDKLSSMISEIDRWIPSKQDKLKMLDKHEYDPNCVYCVNSEFIKDAIATRQSLELDLATRQSIVDQLDVAKHQVESAKHYDIQFGKLVELDQQLQKSLQDRAVAESKQQALLHKQESLTKSSEDTVSKIAAYHKDQQQLLANEVINAKIEECTCNINQNDQQLRKAHKQQNQLYADQHICSHTISTIKKASAEANRLLDQLNVYETYCRAVSKDGIPYDLVSRTVPFIQNYVNNILAQVVDFQVLLETDGKNINAFIVYEGEKWPLELASGMERFVSSLAIRIALIKITNLPKPNFIAIDEGLGVLDSTNLNSMHTLFTYMKDVFKFSLIISHIDVVRDMVDHILTIDRREGFSHIQS